MFARRAWEKVVNFEFLICFILNKFYWQNVYRAPHPSPVAFAGRHLSRCGSVTTRLWMPLASIHYRVAALLPRGEGKGLVLFVILKTYRYQYVFGV